MQYLVTYFRKAAGLQLGDDMEKIVVLFICLTISMVNGVAVLAKEINPSETLPAIVAQFCGQANTVIMWHDINDDGMADYRATYVFKDGKLRRLNKGLSSQDQLRLIIKGR